MDNVHMGWATATDRTIWCCTGVDLAVCPNDESVQIFGKEGDDWKLESTLVGVRARGEGRPCHALYLSLFAPG